MRILIQILVLTSLACTGFAKSEHRSPTPLKDFAPDTKWLKTEMKKMGLPTKFINESLDHYQEETFNTVVTLNLLGFMGVGQHMDRVTPQSVDETSRFIEANQKSFDLAQKKYKVPPTVISALLWIETRHGEDRGRFHTVSVFLHLLQAKRAENRQHLTELAYEKNRKLDNQYTEAELRKIMKERVKKKSDWAKEQLIALSKIEKQKHLNLKSLKGSFAGAFGLPQFIPSSYLEFAKSVKSKATPDLTAPGDAIMSVAYYLSKHGWKNRNAEAKVTALMKYNNSRDYADSILEISKRVIASSP